jgi:hypothetical protein
MALKICTGLWVIELLDVKRVSGIAAAAQLHDQQEAMVLQAASIGLLPAGAERPSSRRP